MVSRFPKELPKFTKKADELTSGLDVWLYFLGHAEMMDVDAMLAAHRLADPLAEQLLNRPLP